MDIKNLKTGDKVLVECTVQAVFANSKMVMVTTRDCTEGFDAYIDEIQEPKTGHYEKHIDHTDCIWYGSDSGCPVTCSQYRDGWNDAMDYIFKNGKGYQLYRHDG